MDTNFDQNHWSMRRSLDKKDAEVDLAFVILFFRLKYCYIVSEKAMNDYTLNYFKQLKEVGVDMTKYLVHLQPVYKPEKEIFVGPSQTD